MPSILLRLTFVLSIVFSITLMYYVFVIQKDYEVFSNIDGPMMTVEEL
jgi:preprotein translocase subunit SecG